MALLNKALLFTAVSVSLHSGGGLTVPFATVPNNFFNSLLKSNKTYWRYEK